MSNDRIGTQEKINKTVVISRKPITRSIPDVVSINSQGLNSLKSANVMSTSTIFDRLGSAPQTNHALPLTTGTRLTISNLNADILASEVGKIFPFNLTFRQRECVSIQNSGAIRHYRGD